MPVVKFINGQFVVPKVRIAFVSFSSGRYLGQEKGLVASVHKYCPVADVFVFHTVEEIGSPSHEISPYSFKVHSIEKVRHLGYEVIIWCDSVIRVNKPIEPLLPIVSSLGVYLAEDGWKSGQWANDKALEYFHLTRDEAMQIETIYACIMMFDFRNPITDQFFQRWKEICEFVVPCRDIAAETGIRLGDAACPGRPGFQFHAAIRKFELFSVVGQSQ